MNTKYRMKVKQQERAQQEQERKLFLEQYQNLRTLTEAYLEQERRFRQYRAVLRQTGKEQECVRFVPCFWFYLLPADISAVTAVSDETYQVYRNVLDFSRGGSIDWAVAMLSAQLAASYAKPSELVFVVKPDALVNRGLLADFSAQLCRKTGMTDGFAQIWTEQEPQLDFVRMQQSHAHYEVYDDFFAGKKVVLFDTAVDTGSSMFSFIEAMETLGAEVVGCMTLGRIFHFGGAFVHSWSRTHVCSGLKMLPEDNGPFRAMSGFLRTPDKKVFI